MASSTIDSVCFEQLQNFSYHVIQHKTEQAKTGSDDEARPHIYINLKRLSEHDSETTGSERAQAEREVYIYEGEVVVHQLPRPSSLLKSPPPENKKSDSMNHFSNNKTVFH